MYKENIVYRPYVHCILEKWDSTKLNSILYKLSKVFTKNYNKSISFVTFSNGIFNFYKQKTLSRRGFWRPKSKISYCLIWPLTRWPTPPPSPDWSRKFKIPSCRSGQTTFKESKRFEMCNSIWPITGLVTRHQEKCLISHGCNWPKNS